MPLAQASPSQDYIRPLPFLQRLRPEQRGDPFGCVPCPARSSRHCFGAFAVPGVCAASALLSHPSGSGSPVSGPPEKRFLSGEPRPLAFRVQETNGRNKEKRLYLNRVTANATNILDLFVCD